MAKKSSTALINPPSAADTTGLAGTPVNNSINLFNCPLSKLIGSIFDVAGANGLSTTNGSGSFGLISIPPITFGG